jgi:hypothetical protein
MSGILTPGYLRWDGTKYVLDSDVEIVGPAGTQGPAGPAGPAGPPGPFGTASGDLLGDYPGPISVVGLTGISGIVNFGSTIGNPTISQAPTGSTQGQPLTFRAQAGATVGGPVVLQSGTGTTAGLIKFIVGSIEAGFFDSNSTFRVGPSASPTVPGPIGPNGSSPVAGTDYIYGFNASGSMWSEYFTSAAAHRSAVGVYNSAAGGTGVNGISIQGVGSTFGVTAYRFNGVIEQNGVSTSGLIFAKALGDGSNRAITGRIWQTGAWCIGDNGINDTSSEAQAVSGALINLSPANFGSVGGATINLVTGTLTSQTTTTGQSTLYNAINTINQFGNLVLQGNLGVALVAQTTVAATVTPTKLINQVGRTHRVRSTTTTPATVVTTDEIISIGTVSSVSTTIAVASNGAALPQATINVASTTGFATTGAIYVTTTNGPQLVTYTGTTGTTFTGCLGGTGVMTTGNAVTSLFFVNLPSAPTTGDIYVVKDANASCGTTNFFISGNGVNIDGQTGIVLSTNYTQATFVYNGSTWISSLANNLIPNGFSSVINVPSSGVQTVVGFDQLLLCDPTSGGCTVNAHPSPLAGLRFTVKDATAQAAPLKPIIVNGNGRNIEDPGNPGFYTSTINITATAVSVTWAYDPTRNRYTVV